MTIEFLRGVRVLDATQLIPGGYTTAKLADLGADVVKLERAPDGDPLRSVPPLTDGVSVMHLQLNRNKRSVMLDVGTSDGRRLFEQLVASADVFVENGRPGAAQRYGMGYEDVVAIRSDIIYCSVSAFGQSGPYARLPAHGAQMEATAGALDPSTLDDAATATPNIRTYVASQAGGLHGALAITAAICHRDRTGKGSYLDVSCWASAVSWHYGNLVSIANTGEYFPGSEGLGARYGCYRAADGGWVMIGLLEPKFWQVFCEAAARPDLLLLEESRPEARLEFRDPEAEDPALRKELRTLFSSRNRDEWVRIALDHELPIAPVLSPRDLLDDPHVRHHGLIESIDHPTTGADTWVVRTPIDTSEGRSEVDRRAPLPSEHATEVIGEWLA